MAVSTSKTRTKNSSFRFYLINYSALNAPIIGKVPKKKKNNNKIPLRTLNVERFFIVSLSGNA